MVHATTCRLLAATWAFVGMSSVGMAQFAGGDGSPGNPWQISTKEQLAAADDTLATYTGHFILINDIDVTGDPAYPLWPRPNQGTRKDGMPVFGSHLTFGGVFDGQGFAIMNKTNSFLNTQRPPQGGTNAVYKNIVFTNCNVGPHFLVQLTGVAAVAPAMYAGANPTFINIHVHGVVSNGAGGATGGLIAGGFGVTVSNCSSSATVYGGPTTGGLIGSMDGSSTATNCTATGDVFGNQDSGGLVGVMSGGAQIYQCSAHGNVTKSTGEYTGGLVGRIVNGGTIRRCFATGDIIRSGANQAGCLVGGTEGAVDVLIEDCYSTGDHPSADQMGPGRNGGFVGNYGRSPGGATHLINRCYSKGDVGSPIGGGFMGRDSGTGGSGVIISNSYASGGTIANSNAAFAKSSGFTVSIANCYWSNSATNDANATEVASESYFYDKANPPFETWDDETVWYFSGSSDPCLRWYEGCRPPPSGVVVWVR